MFRSRRNDIADNSSLTYQEVFLVNAYNANYVFSRLNSELSVAFAKVIPAIQRAVLNDINEGKDIDFNIPYLKIAVKQFDAVAKDLSEEVCEALCFHIHNFKNTVKALQDAWGINAYEIFDFLSPLRERLDIELVCRTLLAAKDVVFEKMEEHKDTTDIESLHTDIRQSFDNKYFEDQIISQEFAKFELEKKANENDLAFEEIYENPEFIEKVQQALTTTKNLILNRTEKMLDEVVTTEYLTNLLIAKKALINGSFFDANENIEIMQLLKKLSPEGVKQLPYDLERIKEYAFSLIQSPAGQERSGFMKALIDFVSLGSTQVHGVEVIPDARYPEIIRNNSRFMKIVLQLPFVRGYDDAHNLNYQTEVSNNQQLAKAFNILARGESLSSYSFDFKTLPMPLLSNNNILVMQLSILAATSGVAFYAVNKYLLPTLLAPWINGARKASTYLSNNRASLFAVDEVVIDMPTEQSSSTQELRQRKRPTLSV